MAEYINRGALVRQIICNMAEFIGTPNEVQKHDERCNYVISFLKSLPTADVAPVRHGRWKCHGDCGVTECSACGWSIEEYVGDYAYCPNCGAKMDEVNE